MESLALAEDAATRSRDALARAQLAEDAAAAAEGLAEMGRTRDHAYAAAGELQRCGGAVADAAASIKQAKAPRNHPVNLAFSPGGSTALSQLVDTWQEAKPTDHLIPDDITNRYNNQSLYAGEIRGRRRPTEVATMSRAEALLESPEGRFALLPKPATPRVVYLIHCTFCPHG